MKNTNVTHTKFPVVIHRFGNVWAVWFKRSGSFLLLEEPAFFVLQLILEGTKPDEVKKVCLGKYGDTEFQTSIFVDEIIQYINKFNNYKNRNRVSKKKEAKHLSAPQNWQFIRYYLFGKTAVRIDYEDEWLRHMIHPSFSHLETTEQIVSKNHIRCYRSGNVLVISRDNEIIEAFAPDEAEYYKGAISQLIYSIIYKKAFKGWMCTLHASGIYAENQALIFSAAAGSGKSTVSAILKARGFNYISDDFIAATINGHVYPFPASMSVKDGSLSALKSYYPELADKVQEKAATGKMVRYLPVHNFSDKWLNGIPVTRFIFVSYQAGSGFYLSEVSKKEALQLLLQETWVNPKTEYVKAFFNWVEKTPFYRMTYSDNEKMISEVRNLIQKSV